MNFAVVMNAVIKRVDCLPLKRGLTHGGESRDILHIYSDRTGKHIRHYFFNAE